MDCIRSSEMMSEALDKRLCQDDAVEFEAHIASCDLCSEEYDLYKSIQDNLNRLGDDQTDLPSGFHEQLMKKVTELNDTTARPDRVLPLWKRVNRRSMNIAAVLVFVVVFALIGINNLDPNKKSNDTVVMEMTGITEETAVEDAAPQVMMDTAPAMEEPEAATPEMAKMAETEEAASNETQLTMTAEPASDEDIMDASDDMTGAEADAVSDSQLARDNNAPVKSPKSIDSNEAVVFSAGEDSKEEQADLPNYWLYIIGGFVAVMALGSVLILRKNR